MNFCKHINKKNIILGVLTTSIATCMTMASMYREYEYFWWGVSGILALIYFYALAYYDSIDQTIDELRKQIVHIDIYRKAFECMVREVQTISEAIAEVVRNGMEHKKLDVWWDFNGVCRKCCDAIYRVITELRLEPMDISVSYVSLCKCKGKRSVKLIAYKNTTSAAPSVYLQERIITGKGHYDLKLFLKNNSEYSILINKEEILNKFEMHSDDSTNKYNQYLAIPVMDDNNEIVGLLQIIAFGNTVLGENRDAVRNLAVSYFRPFISLFLLSYQLDRLIKDGGVDNEKT